MSIREAIPAATGTADAPAQRGTADAGAALLPCDAGSPSTLAGAPSCITAPANRMAQVLRAGIDSLYLSAKGQLTESRAAQLEDLKQRAQSEYESVQTTAQLPLGEHLFCVLDRGRRRFAYVLEDNWFSMALSKPGNQSLPMAHVQISSQALTDRGPLPCAQHLQDLLDQLGHLQSPLTVSRVDVFADFTTSVDFASLATEAWISRSRKRGRYDEDGRLTGLTFGAGGKLSARLYNKSYEITKSRKAYLLDVWRATGWDGISPVWRLEFQAQRAALPPQLLASTADFLNALPTVWCYLLQHWLRLGIPNPGDASREALYPGAAE